MAGIARRSPFSTAGALCDIHHIARSGLHQIREDHRITGYAQEASTSHGPLIRPPVSSTLARMQPIRGRGRERGKGRERERERERERGGGGELIPEVMLEMVGRVMVQTVTTV